MPSRKPGISLGRLWRYTMNDRYGRLSVIKDLGVVKEPGGWKGRKLECRCDCGVVKQYRLSSLKSGNTTSCGCRNREIAAARQTTHGSSATKLYNIWCAMQARCNNPKNKSYPRYGGRGIKIFEGWSSFEQFMADMGHPPPGHSIERIDNDKDYGPGNCRWATPIEQANNRSNSVILTANGESHLLREWSERTGISTDTLRQRIKAGWPSERIVSERVNPRTCLEP